MGFRFQDLMVDVLAADTGQDKGCPHDTTRDKDCPFDTTVDQGQGPCPFDTTKPPPTGKKEPEPPADLTALRQQLHRTLAELR